MSVAPEVYVLTKRCAYPAYHTLSDACCLYNIFILLGLLGLVASVYGVHRGSPKIIIRPLHHVYEAI